MYAFGLRGAAGHEALIDIARSSPSAEDRDYALMVLSYFAPTDAAIETAVSAAVHDQQPGIRSRTRDYLAFSLFAVAGHDPQPRLRELMREGGIRERWRALRALRTVRKHERLLKRIQPR
jgi:hypothetical protein